MKTFLKILISLLICIQISCFWGSKDYAISDMVNDYNTNEYQIYDPFKYLYSSDKQYIQEVIDFFNEKKKFEVFLFLLKRKSSLDNHNIEVYLNDLSFNLLKGDDKRNKNSLFIAYFMDERESRIRTGENVRKILSDDNCTLLQEEIKSMLKSKKYSGAILELFKNIRLDLNEEYNQNRADRIFWDRVWTFIIISIVIGIIVYVVYSTNRKNKTAEETLKKIKEIGEKNKDKPSKFVQTTCVICLEDLDKPNEPGNKTESNEEFIAKLDCGHRFHSKCISEWMAQQNKCPTCRENIDKEDDSGIGRSCEDGNVNNNFRSNNVNNLTRTLYNIQLLRNPHLSNYTVDFTSDVFSWTRNVSTSGSSWKAPSSWGSSSGGSSSRW